VVVACSFQEDMQTERLSECCGAGSTCMRACVRARLVRPSNGGAVVVEREFLCLVQLIMCVPM
jgi:hypothetical protein